MIEDRFAHDANSPELMTYLERRMAHLAEIRARMDSKMAEVASALEGIPGIPETAQQQYLDACMEEVVHARKRLEETRKDIVAASDRLVDVAESARRKLLNDVVSKGRLPKETAASPPAARPE